MTIREIALKAIADEPELIDRMPDEMFDALRNDRDAMEFAMREVVRQTKQGITARFLILMEGRL